MNLVMKKGISKVLLLPILLALVVAFVSQPQSASAHHSNSFSGFPTVKSGSTGNYVKFLQASLDLRYSPGPIDGIFGSQTRSAVIAYQKSKGITADGIVGPNTWNKLRSEFSYYYSGSIIDQTSNYSIVLNTSNDYWSLTEHSSGGSSYVMATGYVK